MILIDTTIFIEIYRNNTVITAIVDDINDEDIAVCDVVRAELFFWSKK
jgi:predicted nucleic acid-binding protein